MSAVPRRRLSTATCQLPHVYVCLLTCADLHAGVRQVATHSNGRTAAMAAKGVRRLPPVTGKMSSNEA
eukprot:2343171-Pyramimonas_sp.AAC.3